MKDLRKIGILLAVFLLVGSVFAGAVAAQPGNGKGNDKGKNKSNDGDVETEGGIGLGSIIDTSLSGSGVLNSGTIWIPYPVSRWLRLYEVRHDGSGQLNVDIYRLPIGSYEIGVIFPNGMTVYPYSATGATYVGTWLSGYNSYHFKKDGWFVSTVHLQVPVKFNAGYGTHGIITVGGSSMGVLGGFFAGASSVLEYLIAGSVGAGSIATIITAAAVSGANVDLLYFNEI